MPLTPSNEFYCPRCPKRYSGSNAAEVEEKVKTHVALQHPDHDPNWFETYPETFAN